MYMDIYTIFNFNQLTNITDASIYTKFYCTNTFSAWTSIYFFAT